MYILPNNTSTESGEDYNKKGANFYFEGIDSAATRTALRNSFTGSYTAAKSGIPSCRAFGPGQTHQPDKGGYENIAHCGTQNGPHAGGPVNDPFNNIANAPHGAGWCWWVYHYHGSHGTGGCTGISYDFGYRGLAWARIAQITTTTTLTTVTTVTSQTATTTTRTTVTSQTATTTTTTTTTSTTSTSTTTTSTTTTTTSATTVTSTTKLPPWYQHVLSTVLDSRNNNNNNGDGGGKQSDIAMKDDALHISAGNQRIVVVQNPLHVRGAITFEADENDAVGGVVAVNVGDAIGQCQRKTKALEEKTDAMAREIKDLKKLISKHLLRETDE